MSVSSQNRTQTAAIPGIAAGRSAGLPWLRIAKLGAAVAIVGVGASAVFVDQASIAANNAVVSAYSVSLRAPIDGIVGELPLHIGDKVGNGALLADINNSRVDDQRLVDLNQHLVQSSAQLAAIKAEQQTLAALQAGLNLRSQAYIAATSARFRQSLAEAQSTLNSLTERRDQSGRNLERLKGLVGHGAATAVALEQARSDFAIAGAAMEAQQNQVGMFSAELKAAENGVLSEPGSTDVAYSQQRADEIAIRMAELSQQLAISDADVSATQARVDAEKSRIEKLQTAAMTAPTAGIIWKLNASPGEHISAGDTIAQVVDCNAAFIVATIPQNRVPEIEVGSTAQFMLPGDSSERHGRVLSVTGDTTTSDRNLAAVPFNQTDSEATVRIEMEHNDATCLVGRTARVLFPSSRPGIVSQFLSRFNLSR